MKRVFLQVVLFLLILFTVACLYSAIALRPAFGYEVRSNWVLDYKADNGVRDQFTGEAGIDCGGPASLYCQGDDLNLTPNNVSYTVTTVGGVNVTREKGLLNGGIYCIYEPMSIPLNGKALITHRASSSNDLYHAFESQWTGGTYSKGTWAEDLGAAGWIQAGVDGNVGAHPVSFSIQRNYELALYLKQEYGVDEVYFSGGSYGALIAPYLTFLFPDVFDGGIGLKPIAFDLPADVNWSRLQTYKNIGVSAFLYGWNYDPSDEPGLHDTLRLFFENDDTYAPMNFVDRMVDMGSPLIMICGEDDARLGCDLWQARTDKVPSDVLRIEAYHFVDHSGVDDYYQLYLDANGTSPVDDLVTMAANHEPSSRPGRPRTMLNPPLFDEILNDKPNSKVGGRRPGMFVEKWRKGFGSGGGLFDSALVEDVTGDGLIDVVVGSHGGDIHLISQTAAGSKTFELVDQQIGNINCGWGTFGLAYEQRGDDHLIYTGTATGRLFVFDPVAGEKLFGPSATDFGSDIQWCRVTDDLDGNGTKELFFRTWNRYEGEGGVLWAVEYNADSKKLAVKLKQPLDCFTADFEIYDCDADGILEVVSTSGRGGLAIFELETDPFAIDVDAVEWSFISELNYQISTVQYCFIQLERDDDYLYAVTTGTKHYDFSTQVSHLVEQTPGSEGNHNCIFVLDSANLTNSDAIVDRIDAGVLPYNVTASTVDGTKWLTFCEPKPVARTVAANGTVSTVEADPPVGFTDGEYFVDHHIVDLDGDGTPEVVGVDKGGTIVVMNFDFDPLTFDDPGEGMAVEGRLLSLSRTQAMAESGGSIYVQKNGGFLFQIDPTDGSIENDPETTEFNGGMYLYGTPGDWTVSSSPIFEADFDVFGEGTVTLECVQEDVSGTAWGGMLEQGVGQWRSAQCFAAGEANARTLSAAIACDYDGDGDNDVLTINQGGVVRGFDKSTTTGQLESIDFTSAFDLGKSPVGIDAADLIGDAAAEVIVGVTVDRERKGRLYWLNWNGSNYEIDPYRVAYFSPFVWGVKIHDFGSDGREEIIVGDGAGYLYVLDLHFRELWRSPKIGSFMGSHNSIIVVGDTVVVGNTDCLVAFEYTESILP